MKIHEITIKPCSPFATELKGDTIFGQFCWQIVYSEDLLGITIKTFLKDYDKKPLVIFSSAYFITTKHDGSKRYFLKKPDLPLNYLFNFKDKDKSIIVKERKEIKKRKWLVVDQNSKLLQLKDCEYINDLQLTDELSSNNCNKNERQQYHNDSPIFNFNQQHNTINRLTNTTDERGSGPFVVPQYLHSPETELVIFVGIDESLKIEDIKNGLKRIGDFGFGKDASTGLGRFEIIDCKETSFNYIDQANAFYTLSPCVPDLSNNYKEVFFTPFIRFGKHGDKLAKSENQFKNPIIMADEGAVFVQNQPLDFNKPYIGSSVTNLSKAKKETVAQGYSLYLPVELEVMQ